MPMHELLPPTQTAQLTKTVVCGALTITEKAEQHICTKFCQKHGHSCSETSNMIQKAFGNEAMGHTQVMEWFRLFKEGQTSAESDERSGRPSTGRKQLGAFI